MRFLRPSLAPELQVRKTLLHEQGSLHEEPPHPRGPDAASDLRKPRTDRERARGNTGPRSYRRGAEQLQRLKHRRNRFPVLISQG